LKSKLVKREKCIQCGESLEFKIRSNVKYCCTKCRDEARKESGYHKRRRENITKRSEKNCVFCGNNIIKAGNRKGVSKFCSDKCMVLANRRHNSVRVPVDEYSKMQKALRGMTYLRSLPFYLNT